MGIYSNGSIFGIQIYDVNDEDDVIHILYEEKYEEIMSHEQMREAYLFYMNLNLSDTNKLFIKIYTECSSTLNGHDHNRNFMMWQRIPLNTFIEKCNV